MQNDTEFPRDCNERRPSLPGADDDRHFDRASDWAPWSRAPLGDVEPGLDAGHLTRELPTLYQIAPPSVQNGGLQ